MAGIQTRKPQQEILKFLSEEKENVVILQKDIMISILQENKKYFNVVANLTGKSVDTFNTVSKSINESNKNMTKNNKTLTELINNLTIYFSKSIPQAR